MNLYSLRKTVTSFCHRRGYEIHSPDACRGQCGEWNQQIGLELSRCGHKTRMEWVFHPDLGLHCFVSVDNLWAVDVTARQLDPDGPAVRILPLHEVWEEGWVSQFSPGESLDGSQSRFMWKTFETQ